MSGISLSPESQLGEIRRGVVDLVSEADLLAKLRRGRRLRVKLGLDPTAPDIHLGHTVVLNKLRQFQDLGHQAVLIIGDGTALVGDPSEKNKTRPLLSPAQIKENLETYLDQVKGVLLVTELEVVYNSAWLSTMTLQDMVKLASHMTVARMLERDSFQKRLRANEPIAVHEFLYPLMQAYDSVMVRADVELGGTDQTFNLLVGRDIQRAYGQEAQVCLTTPLLEGLDGNEKMSKSLGNTVGLKDPPDQMYGKIMSIPDRLIEKYLRLLTAVQESAIAESLAPGRNPRDAKALLGRTLVGRYHGEASALDAENQFRQVFSEGRVPDEMPEVRIDGKTPVWIVKVILAAGFATSSSEARRLLEQGGVTIDGEVVPRPDSEVTPKDGAVLKVGKRRFARLRVV